MPWNKPVCCDDSIHYTSFFPSDVHGAHHTNFFLVMYRFDTSVASFFLTTPLLFFFLSIPSQNPSTLQNGQLSVRSVLLSCPLSVNLIVKPFAASKRSTFTHFARLPAWHSSTCACSRCRTVMADALGVLCVNPIVEPIAAPKRSTFAQIRRLMHGVVDGGQVSFAGLHRRLGQ